MYQPTLQGDQTGVCCYLLCGSRNNYTTPQLPNSLTPQLRKSLFLSASFTRRALENDFRRRRHRRQTEKAQNFCLQSEATKTEFG